MVKVFVTGGTGFVGSRLIRPSRTTGLELDKLNVNIIQGPVTDLDIIASAAAGSEAVTHMAFGHQETIEQDIAVIQTIKKALQSSGKLFVSTCTTLVMGDTKQDTVSEAVPTSHGQGA